MAARASYGKTILSRGLGLMRGGYLLYVEPKALAVNLKHTAGSSSMWSRVNCNDFVQHIIEYQGFKPGECKTGKRFAIQLPSQYEVDFDRGLVL